MRNDAALKILRILVKNQIKLKILMGKYEKSPENE